MKIGSTDVASVKMGDVDVVEIRMGNFLVWQKPTMMLMSQPSIEEQPVVEDAIVEETTTTTVQEKKGIFTGMWSFFKNIFKIQ